MAFITLIGDSTLANIEHVGPPDLITQLRKIMPTEWQAHLSAIDGARVADVLKQLSTIPPQSTHLVLSVGGNDAIALTGLLRSPTPNLGSALAFMDRQRRSFAERYRGLLSRIRPLNLRTLVCTVYNPRIAPPERQRIVETLVSLLNDAIISAAIEHQCPVLDLRALAKHPENFVSPIEFNHRGASRLADAIIDSVRGDVFEGPTTRIQSAAPPNGSVGARLRQ